MVEKNEAFSPSLVEKVTGIIRRVTEAGRDPDGWKQTFVNRILSRSSEGSVLSDDAILGLAERFGEVYQYCENPPVVVIPPEAVVIFQADQIPGKNGKGCSGNNGNGNDNGQRHSEGLSQLPPASAALYLRAQAAKRGLLQTQRSDNQIRR